jgi:hypothetical protein
LFIIWRIWIKRLANLLHSSSQRGSYLAIFLFGAAGPILLFGLLGQPTNLGFAAFGVVYALLPRFPKKNLIEDKKEGLIAFQFSGRQTVEHVAVWRFA